jgi:tRNA threonylcarbamoyladenosine biosynthesis protein TsaE
VVDIDRSKKSGRPPGSGGRSVPDSQRRTVFSLSEEETFKLGRVVARGLHGGELILLEGDLGLGKTVFAKGIAEGLGIPRDDVTSPSFTLVQEYEGGRFPVFHVDLYRIEVAEEIGTLGIEEILAAGGVVIVEWGEKLPPYLRRGAITVRFRDVGEGSRQIEILPSGGTTPTPHSDA